MSSEISSSAPPSSISISAEAVESNDDLLIEILLFLPALSLVKFKVVTKRWRSLISAPFFCRRHTVHHRRSETQHLLILDRGRGYDSKYLVCDPTVPRLFPLPLRLEAEILQFCNGLILARCRKKGKLNRYIYYVLNPTTMQQRELSPLPSSNAVGAIYLMFDPSLSPHYKVVSFVFAKPFTSIIYVYDSETHQWKVGGEHNRWPTCFRDGIYVDDGIYFVRFHQKSSSRRFIVHDNSVSKIPNPPRDYTGHRNYAMESNGNLLYLILSSNVLIVYEMKKNENTWSEKYKADMNPIMATCGENIHLVGMIRGEKEQVVLKVGGKIMIIIYRFCDNGFEVLLDLNQRFQEKGNYRYEYDGYLFQSKGPYGFWYRDPDAYLLIQSLAPI